MVKPQAVTDDDFTQEVLESEVPVLVDFWADWCGPCKMVAPTVEEIANDYDGRVKVVKLDTDANPLTSAKYGIRSIPTLLIFKNGEPVGKPTIGAALKQMITAKLDEVVN